MINDIMQIMTTNGDELIFQVAKENDKYFIVKNAVRVSSSYEYTDECIYAFYPLFVNSTNKRVFIYKHSIISSVPPTDQMKEKYTNYVDQSMFSNEYINLNEQEGEFVLGKVEQTEPPSVSPEVQDLREQNAILQALINNIGNNIKYSNVYVDSDGTPHYALDKNKLH